MQKCLRARLRVRGWTRLAALVAYTVQMRPLRPALVAYPVQMRPLTPQVKAREKTLLKVSIQGHYPNTT